MTAPSTSLVGVNEAAELCGVHAGTIRRWINTGVLPASRLGNKTIRIDREDLENVKQPATGSDYSSNNELVVARIAAKISKEVDAAPPLTSEQISRLVALLTPTDSR